MKLLTTKFLSEDTQALLKDGLIDLQEGEVVMTNRGIRIQNTITLTRAANATTSVLEDMVTYAKERIAKREAAKQAAAAAEE